MLDLFTKQHSVAFVFHGEIRYFRHGQGGDGMLEDSPAAHNNYTVGFYVWKQIATSSKLRNYILSSSTWGA